MNGVKLILPLSRAVLAVGRDVHDAYRNLVMENYITDRTNCILANKPVRSYIYYARYVLRVKRIVNVRVQEISND